MAVDITETARLMEANLLQVFNERDPARRREVIARTYTADMRWTGLPDSYSPRRARYTARLAWGSWPGTSSPTARTRLSCQVSTSQSSKITASARNGPS
jgi:hypothetical protein